MLATGRRHAAVFLDRDGVLIEDVDLLVRPDQATLIDGVAAALRKLSTAGFRLVMVTNQTVVARGLSTLSQVQKVHRRIDAMLLADGGPVLDGRYVCPHHPHATLPRYRVLCDCRKPRHGLLLRAAHEHGLDLRASFFVGDRLTDIATGAAAGCRTVLVGSGRHAAPPIVTVDPLDDRLAADHECAALPEAADYILSLRT